jgi:albonoursin synthase
VLGEGNADEVCALDAGATGGYLSLAAPALGLAICWTTSWTPPPIQAVLGLPERIKPYLLVAVGRPARDAPKAPRRFEPVVHRERFAE